MLNHCTKFHSKHANWLWATELLEPPQSWLFLRNRALYSVYSSYQQFANNSTFLYLKEQHRILVAIWSHVVATSWWLMMVKSLGHELDNYRFLSSSEGCTWKSIFQEWSNYWKHCFLVWCRTSNGAKFIRLLCSHDLQCNVCIFM